MSAKYTKMQDGSWGIRVSGNKPYEGQMVTVTTAGGASKSETVRKVIWSGDDRWNPGQQVTLCAIEQRMRPSGGKKCGFCGSRHCDGAKGGQCEHD